MKRLALLYFFLLVICMIVNANALLYIDSKGNVLYREHLLSNNKIITSLSVINTDELKLKQVSFVNKERSILKFYIQKKKYSILGSKEELFLHIYDFNNDRIVFRQSFFFRSENNNEYVLNEVDTSIRYSDFRYQEKYLVRDYINKFSIQVTPEINNKHYCIYGLGSGIRIFDTIYSNKDSLFIDLPNNEINTKFLRFGYANLTVNIVKQQLIYDFWKETQGYSNNPRSSVCEIRAFNFLTQDVKVLIEDASNASCSNDGNFLVFQKCFKKKGYKKIQLEGFYIYNYETGLIVAFENCLSAIWVRDS